MKTKRDGLSFPPLLLNVVKCDDEVVTFLLQKQIQAMDHSMKVVVCLLHFYFH